MSNYPTGARYDEDAPYNQKEQKPVTYIVSVEETFTRVFDVQLDSYPVKEVIDDEGHIHEEPVVPESLVCNVWHDENTTLSKTLKESTTLVYKAVTSFKLDESTELLLNKALDLLAEACRWSCNDRLVFSDIKLKE